MVKCVLMVGGLVLLSGVVRAARPIIKIQLPEPLNARVVTVVTETEAFHRAYVSQDNVQKEKQTQALIKSIDRAVEVAGTAKEQGIHIKRILETAKNQLNNIGESSGDTKKKFLEEAFRQLIILLRNYELKLNYKIYFCNGDKSFWLQAGNKPLNPVNPDGRFAKCGSVMQ